MSIYNRLTPDGRFGPAYHMIRELLRASAHQISMNQHVDSRNKANREDKRESTEFAKCKMNRITI